MNKHIIIGENNKCCCGVYNGESMTCNTIIKTIERLYKRANDGQYGVRDDGFRLARVLTTLVKDVDEQPTQITSPTAEQIAERCADDCSMQLSIAAQNCPAVHGQLLPKCFEIPIINTAILSAITESTAPLRKEIAYLKSMWDGQINRTKLTEQERNNLREQLRVELVNLIAKDETIKLLRQQIEADDQSRAPLLREIEELKGENKTLRGMCGVGTQAIMERDNLRRQLKEANESHGRTLLMCEKTIKDLRQQLNELKEKLNEK